MDVPELPAPGADGHRQGHLPPRVFPRYTQRAFIVAADATRRKSLVEWHHKAGYVVTDCSNPVAATAILQDGRERFSLVVLDAFPSCVGSLEFLKCAISEMRLRVYGISKVGHFWGPLDMEDLKTVCQTITCQALNKSRLPEATLHDQSNNSVSTTTTVSYCGRRAIRRRKRQPSDTESQEVEQDGKHGDEQRQRPKKARLVWTEELHQKFLDAYNKLLPGDAVPKKILKLMNDTTLTRENIASHLQKYRLTLNLKQLEPHPLPPHRSTPPTKSHRAAPSEASMSFNMSQNKEIYMAGQVSQAVYMNYDFNCKPVIRTPMVNGIMQNNHPELHMQVFDYVKVNKECIAPMVNPRNESARKCVVPKEMYIGSQVGHEHDVAPKSTIIYYHNNSDDIFQEDFNQIIEQTLNKDPGTSWEHDYLHNVD